MKCYTDILNLWLEEKKQYVRNSTYCNYSCLINAHFLEYFKNVEIENITKTDIKNFQISLSQKMTAVSILNIQKILSQSLKYAVENDYITQSPYIKVKFKSNVKEIQIFTEEEIEKILKTATFPIYANITEVAYYTGMRIGEIMTLKWEDIDFKNNFLMVRRTFSKYLNGTPVIESPKTFKSMRRIDLDDHCMEILTQIPHESEYVFSSKIGKGGFLSYTIITKRFKEMCEKAQVPYRSFHTLRHSHASFLLANGVYPQIVQERLGHARIGITMDTYSHLLPGMQKMAVDVLNNKKLK